MRLESAKPGQTFGSVEIHPVRDVVELEAGSSESSYDTNGRSSNGTVVIGTAQLNAIKAQMAIVVCAMDEDIRTIRSVWAGIPHACLLLFVSNSRRHPVDQYAHEARALRQYGASAQRDALSVHQGDPALAAAFADAGLPALVDPATGRVRSGKGEAMLVGMALAAMTGRRYVGFVDADNLVPGSVREYCDVFAAGLALSADRQAAAATAAMVRIAWNAKPKAEGSDLVFETQGRSSRLVNRWLNRTLQAFDKRGTDILATGNAGEHAMTLALGLRLRLAGGFAIEPYELIHLFEQQLMIAPRAKPESDQTLEQEKERIGAVELHQIRTQNPHFHSNKGDDHVQGMRREALDVLYHSDWVGSLPDEVRGKLRAQLQDEMVRQGMLSPGEESKPVRIYDPVGNLDLCAICRHLLDKSDTLTEVSCGWEEGVGHLILPELVLDNAI